jgi:UDP-glucose 4-epimerase
MNSRIWIIGGAGLIGTTLTGQLQAAGCEVLVSDSLGALANAHALTRPLAEAALRGLEARVAVHRLDVRDEAGMVALARQFRPDVVVWLAALLASESRARPDEATAVQVTALERFLASGVDVGRRVVMTSSSYVYGHFLQDPAPESHPPGPIDPYGRTKLQAEAVLAAAGERLGIEVAVLRPSAVYGPGDPRPRFVPRAVEAALAGGPVVAEDADFISDFTFVDDAAAGIALVATSQARPLTCCNVAFGRAHTNLDFARALAARCECRLEMGPSDWRETGYIPARGALDISLARSFGYEPQFGLEGGIDEFLRRREELLALA